MPVSSRKRNKGKDRKAKQAAKKEESERGDAHRIWRDLCSTKGCDHGCGVMISGDHPVSSFIDQFTINSQIKDMVVSHNVVDLFETHTQIWNNHSYKELAIGILVRIGTNMLLQVQEASFWPVYIAKFLGVLEHYSSGDIIASINSRVATSKSRDLDPNASSGRRDVLKFFRKRISCKCLKRMHLEARKSETKMGNCYNCGKEMERTLLSVCSQCMVTPYCSRECQVADWPNHGGICDQFVRHQEMMNDEEQTFC